MLTYPKYKLWLLTIPTRINSYKFSLSLIYKALESPLINAIKISFNQSFIYYYYQLLFSFVMHNLNIRVLAIIRLILHGIIVKYNI